MSEKRVKYISASQVELFLACPMCYKRTYVGQAVREPPSIYLAWGGSIHETFAHNYRQKIKTRKDLPIPECIEFFETEFRKQLKTVPSEDWKMTPLLEIQGEEMVREYMRTQAPGIQPVLVEHEFELDMGEGLIIKGFIDLVDDKDVIRDYKTCSKTTVPKWTQERVDRMVQLTMYSAAFRKEFKRREAGVQIDLLKRLSGGPRFDSILTQRTDDQVMNLIQLMLMMNTVTEHDLWYVNPYTCGNNCMWTHGEPEFPTKQPLTAPVSGILLPGHSEDAQSVVGALEGQGDTL